MAFWQGFKWPFSVVLVLVGAALVHVWSKWREYRQGRNVENGGGSGA